MRESENSYSVTNLSLDSKSLIAQRKIELLGLTNLNLHYKVPDFGLMVSRRLRLETSSVSPTQISNELKNLSTSSNKSLFLFIMAVLATIALTWLALKNQVCALAAMILFCLLYFCALQLSPNRILLGHRGLKFQYALGPLLLSSPELHWQQLTQIESGKYFCSIVAPVGSREVPIQLVLPKYEVQAVNFTFTQLSLVQRLGCALPFLAMSVHFSSRGATIPIRLDSIPQAEQLTMLRNLVSDQEHKLDSEAKISED